MTAVSTPSVLANPLAATLPASQAAVRTAGFAQVLDAHRAESAPAPAPAPAPEAKAEEAHAQANRTAEETRQRQLRLQRQTAARPASEVPAPKPAEAKVADERPEAADRVHGRKAAEDDVPVDPALADLLASLNLRATPPASGEAVTPEGEAAAEPGVRAETARPDLAATADTATRGAVRRQAADVGDGSEAGQDGGSDTARRQHRVDTDDLKARGHDAATPLVAQPEASPAMWQAALEQAATPAAEARRSPETARVDGAAAASALSSAAPERPVAEASAPTVVHLPTPADAPDFPQALGAQLSVFAQDGVQQAELHLNPAEMGSISIQIALDGNQAKVDFGADSAATRQLIENGLPELAAALRDAGFTLAGGGVHSQARQSGERDGGREARGEGRSTARVSAAGAGGEPAAPAGVTPRTVRAGGVDTYV